ncbi:MAG TPA: HNH endonuclease [Actinobacteria bacterium]|nr:HNH endonuclease [Actinomycetota bacterium]
MEELPDPHSDELRRLVPNAAVRVVYEVLYSHRATGITMGDLRREAAPLLQEMGLADDPEQLDRRKRDLHAHFEIQVDPQHRHRLVGRRSTPLAPRSGIPLRARAIVLAPQRCAMCGRTPLEDQVKLVIDHKIPLDWGGTNELDNLQPLCEDCNAGKKDHFATLDQYADKIRLAVGFDEPHRRIGELLKAFGGDWVPEDLLSAIASAKQYQADWQKRTRELRTLGWDITTRRKREGGRTRVWYSAVHWEPWPEGNIRAEISRREKGVS